MARPTEPKIRKLRTDLEKIESKLRQLRSIATDMTVNPKGSDVELCRQVKAAVASLVTATEQCRDARAALEAPERILRNRRSK